jgi:hypothetical protein
MGAGITKDFANQSELARDLMLGAARREIRIVQQDLGFALGRADTLFPDSAIDRLIDFLRTRPGRQSTSCCSKPGAKGKSGMTYSNDVSLEQLARHLPPRSAASHRGTRSAVALGDPPRPRSVNAMLCEHVHLAPYRFGPTRAGRAACRSPTMPSSGMVDGPRVLYRLRQLCIPSTFRSVGYIVDDEKAAQELSDAYWTPLWQWSSRAAGVGARRREMHLPRRDQVIVHRQPRVQGAGGSHDRHSLAGGAAGRSFGRSSHGAIRRRGVLRDAGSALLPLCDQD